MRRVEKFVNSCSSVTIFKVQKWFSFTSGLTSPKIHVSLGTSSRNISMDLVAFFQKMVCFTKFWSTILEILVWKLWAFCQIFVESALFLIFCLVSNCKPDSCEQGKGDRLTANVHIGKKYFHFIVFWKYFTFYQIFISHQMIALQKLWKMFFISSKKLLSFSRYSTFCDFFPFLFTLSRFKRTNGSGITGHEMTCINLQMQ